MFMDEEPAIARLCVVEALAAGERVLERRAEVLDELATVIDEGRAAGGGEHEPPELTAEGIVGAVFAVVHTRLLDRDAEPLTDLLGALMSMIVLPYVGAQAASAELRRPRLKPRRGVRRQRSRRSGDPLEGLNMRLTYRTVRVLTVIAAQPGASNREIAERSGIVDQGQISKLLARLARLELVENGRTVPLTAHRRSSRGGAALSTVATPGPARGAHRLCARRVVPGRRARGTASRREERGAFAGSVEHPCAARADRSSAVGPACRARAAGRAAPRGRRGPPRSPPARTLARSPSASLCSPARRAIPHRQGQRGGGGEDVRGPAQAVVATLVAAPAAGPAERGTRDPPRRRERLVCEHLPRGTRADGRGGSAGGLSELPGASRRAARRPGADGAAAQEARRIHQAREGPRPLRARARATGQPTADGDGRVRWAGVRAAHADAHAGGLRAARQASLQAPRGAPLARAPRAPVRARPLDGRGCRASRWARRAAQPSVLHRSANRGPRTARL